MSASFRPVDDALTAPPASERLADLGFLAGPDLPDRPGPAFLLVALRDAPTLRHYDPERIEYWVTQRGRGVRQELTRATPMPIDGPFSWGMIRLIDRLSVTNEYLTFGGRLSAAEIDDATIAVFTSPAPMLRRGGHSQIWDQGTEELGAFFARLVAAVDEYPELEPHLAAADPLVRYAVFLADVVERYRASPELRALEPQVWTLLRGEESLMRREHGAAWQAGTRILAECRARSRHPVAAAS
jgi:hypothetical protein